MGNTGTEEPRKPEAFFLIITEQKPKKPSIMSTLSYAWNVHGTFNGEFMSASGTTASVDGIAEVHGTAGEGGPFNHSSWIWGGFGHYGLGYIKGGHKENPTEKYPFHMTRHWRGEDGAHIWSSHHVTGAEGARAGDVDVVAEYFQPEGPIMKGLINGQYPSHWIATKRSDKEVDVWGTVTLKVEGGGTYTAYVHEYMQFYEPCVTINRHYWKLEYLAAEYYPDHWYHKEAAVVDPNWTWGNVTDKTTFSWHLSGSPNNKAISADGYGYGTATVSTTGAKVARDSASMVSPTWPGPSPGRDTLACTSSLASPRVWSTLSSMLCLRVSPLRASGMDRTVTTGPPPTMSGVMAITSTREFSSSAPVSNPAA